MSEQKSVWHMVSARGTVVVDRDFVFRALLACPQPPPDFAAQNCNDMLLCTVHGQFSLALPYGALGRLKL